VLLNFVFTEILTSSRRFVDENVTIGDQILAGCASPRQGTLP
jgi:hypothetical protein